MKDLKKLGWCLLVFFGMTGSLSAQESYEYFLDLTQVKDDQVKVVLKTPDMKKDVVTFYMPKIIPGTYAIADYGRFVSNFKAYDKKGKALNVSRTSVNSWEISNAKKLATISYWVDDTFDFEFEEDKVFWPAGSNIEEGENFVISTPGFFGYFDEEKKRPFKFNVIRPQSFYGTTGLIKEESSTVISAKINGENLSVEQNERVDTFIANDYDHLIDSPLMYAETDTTIIMVDGTEVLIGCYSPTGKITSKEIAGTLEATLQAQKQYLKGVLPVKKYAFILYFTDQPVFEYGALEHSYSSMYYLPEGTLEEVGNTVSEIAAHEFFHIITPLTIHSEEIHNFDFNDPKMSKHLWLYEGVTEYFSHNALVQGGLVDKQSYMLGLREKMIYADTFNDSLPFTELSKYAHTQHKDEYQNVYQKGALIAMCLDLELLRLSEGKMNLRDLMLKLSEKYGKTQAFKDDELFKVITEMTYPEIGEFFSTYVDSEERLNIEKYLAYAGVTYKDKMGFETLSFGFDNMNIGLNEAESRLMIQNAENLNEIGQALGLQNGDVLMKIDGKEVPAIGPNMNESIAAIQQYFGSLMQSMKDGQELNFVVKRANEEGNLEEIELSTTNKAVMMYERHIIMPNPAATEAENQLRSWWLEGIE